MLQATLTCLVFMCSEQITTIQQLLQAGPQDIHDDHLMVDKRTTSIICPRIKCMLHVINGSKNDEFHF